MTECSCNALASLFFVIIMLHVVRTPKYFYTYVRLGGCELSFVCCLLSVSLLSVRKAKRYAASVSVYAHKHSKAEPTKAEPSGYEWRSRLREGTAEQIPAFFANILSNIHMKQLDEGKHELAIFMCCCVNLV